MVHQYANVMHGQLDHASDMMLRQQWLMAKLL
jgi:hypothetical protein